MCSGSLSALPFPTLLFWGYNCPRTMIAGSRSFCEQSPSAGFTYTVNATTDVFTAAAGYTPTNGDTFTPDANLVSTLPAGMLGITSYQQPVYVVCQVSGQNFKIEQSTYGGFLPPQTCTGTTVDVTTAGTGTLTGWLIDITKTYYLDADPTGFPMGTTFEYLRAAGTSECNTTAPQSGGKYYAFNAGQAAGTICIIPTIPVNATPGIYPTQTVWCGTSVSTNCTTFDWDIDVIAPPSVSYTPPVSFSAIPGLAEWQGIMIARPCPGSSCGDNNIPPTASTVSGPANYCVPLTSTINPINALGTSNQATVSYYSWNLLFDNMTIYTGNTDYRTNCFAHGMNRATYPVTPSTLAVGLPNNSMTTSIVLVSGAAYESNMILQIDAEQFGCGVLTVNTFANCERGYNSTGPNIGAHSIGASVSDSGLPPAKQFITQQGGAMSAIGHFTESSFRACRVFSDNSYCTAGLLMKNNIVPSLGPVQATVAGRPMAYGLDDIVALVKYGGLTIADLPHWTNIRDGLYSLVQRATESTVSGVRYALQQYQLGLIVHALIADWQLSGDTRAPWMAKRVADLIWEDYDQVNHVVMNIEGPSPSPWCSDVLYPWFMNDVDGSCGVHGLGFQRLQMHEVVPFWWYYAYTGNTTYRDRGDDIFNHVWDNVQGAGIGGPSGKDASEEYYNSFNDVAWRSGSLTVSQWYGDPVTVSGRTISGAVRITGPVSLR